jgi:hypothetical protein
MAAHPEHNSGMPKMRADDPNPQVVHTERLSGVPPRQCPPHMLRPGQYVKRRLSTDYGEFDAWWYCTPNGLLGRLSAPEDLAAGKSNGAHHVEEHDDGTISVLPQPGNSNSILCMGWPLGAPARAEGQPLWTWHGYIRHGVWEEC